MQLVDGRLQRFILADDVASATWTIRPSPTSAPETLRYSIDSDGAVWLDGRIGGDAVRMRLRPVDPQQFPLLRKGDDEMRKQYFFRPSPGGFAAWDVDRLIELTASFPRRRVRLSDLRELDEPWFGDGEAATWAALVEHVKLMDAADLSFPIILAADGRVMDGMHRVAKALWLEQVDIEAVQFVVDPPPTHVDVQPEDLPY